jgi:serine/threonine protein kinase
VREEVRKLLEAEKRPALEGPIAGNAGSRESATGNRPVPDHPFAGRGRHGRGVRGRAGPAPHRRVALKAIRAGLASPEMLRRFEDEAQALARLHHPGIAQIYEAGAADTGFGTQPYFAMEFIQGASLVRYAEEHRLNMRQRLELMARICEAVHHAHQRGIIHRDLKPANILVDESGQPKIVDFGVARATELDAQVTRQTNSGQILGTLAYMSPEQVLADPLELDTRSDVCALGVILYELLAGRLPYQVSDRLPQAVQTIREEDPAPLSSINRTYRGDVETIAAKALEKDKVRRYSSAAELGADIQRYLNERADRGAALDGGLSVAEVRAPPPRFGGWGGGGLFHADGGSGRQHMGSGASAARGAGGFAAERSGRSGAAIGTNGAGPGHRCGEVS